MQEARVNGRLVTAGPDAPLEAVCPACGGVVIRRKRRGGDGEYTYFYRHQDGVEMRCPRRYHP
ncbi:MAG: hypothetical protein GX620_13220 [Chloroflexi bacterium]|nr:hypothetical protein [Chloroflexota bacterium]